MLRENGGVLDQLSELVDISLMGLGFYLIIDLYEAKGVFSNSDIPLSYFLFFLIYILLWILSANAYRVYGSRRFMSLQRELIQLLKAHFLAFAIAIVLLSLYNPQFINNRFIFYYEAVVLLLAFSTHTLVRVILQGMRKSGRNTRYALLLGSGPAAKQFLDKVHKNPQLGYRVIGYLAPERNGANLHYLGDYGMLEAVLKQKIIDIVVVTASISDEGIKEYLELVNTMGKNVMIMLDETVSKVARSRPVDFGGLPMVAYDSYPRRPWQEAGKRLFDFWLTAIGLLFISPLLASIALAIKFTSPGSAIFAQERVGLNGRVFKMYKFRSMVQDAEKQKEKLTHLNEMTGPVFKIKNDPRITPVGGFLRRTSLDELPQLWNVLKGDMSLVGPRPPLPSEVNLYDPKHRKRLAVKPGITCIWQISGRNEVDFEQWMEMDAEYVERWSLWLDMEILAKTVPVVLMRKGAS